MLYVSITPTYFLVEPNSANYCPLLGYPCYLRIESAIDHFNCEEIYKFKDGSVQLLWNQRDLYRDSIEYNVRNDQRPLKGRYINVQILRSLKQTNRMYKIPSSIKDAYIQTVGIRSIILSKNLHKLYNGKINYGRNLFLTNQNVPNFSKPLNMAVHFSIAPFLEIFRNDIQKIVIGKHINFKLKNCTFAYKTTKNHLAALKHFESSSSRP